MLSLVKTTINLPESLWESLTRRAAQDQMTRSEALRRAVWLYTYVRSHQEKNGAELLLGQERIVLEGTDPTA